MATIDGSEIRQSSAGILKKSCTSYQAGFPISIVSKTETEFWEISESRSRAASESEKLSKIQAMAGAKLPPALAQVHEGWRALAPAAHNKRHYVESRRNHTFHS